MGSPDRTPLRIRPAARAVMTDPDFRLLLVHFEIAWDPTIPGGLWACPGGGIDAGESPEEALRRELREELGFEVSDPGEPIWQKEAPFPVPSAQSKWDGQRDTYFWIEVPAVFDPRPHLTEAELRAENVNGMRWWTQEELWETQSAYDEEFSDHPAYGVFSPRRLAHLVDELIRDGRPSGMRQIGPL